jgi:hypothetical protein
MIRALVPVLLAAALPAAAQYTRSIAFSGNTWMVKKSSNKVGPGPNLFSDSAANVWVDDQGKLHLKITRSGNRWQCAEVINMASPGFGTYRFYVDTPVDNLDKNVVLGLFTWNDDPAYNHREIDIEFARWGNGSDLTNAQYVVQPYDLAGNLVRFTQPPSTPQSIHSFRWSSGSVSHRSVKGTDAAAGALIAEHTFTSGIPQPGGENARVNLWLYQGRQPSNRQPVEVVISKYEYLP